MHRTSWYTRLRPAFAAAGVVHLVLIGIVLLIGIAIGLYWSTTKEASLPNTAVMQVQAGRFLQNGLASFRSFFAQLNFWSKPNEGGISAPSGTLDSYLPGHVPTAAFAAGRKPEGAGPGAAPATDTGPQTDDPAAQPLDQAH